MACQKERGCFQQQETKTMSLSRLQTLGTNQPVMADAGGFDLQSWPQGPNIFFNWISVCLTGSSTYSTETGKGTQMERQTKE